MQRYTVIVPKMLSGDIKCCFRNLNSSDGKSLASEDLRISSVTETRKEDLFPDGAFGTILKP
jgi:hypothetical protein